MNYAVYNIALDIHKTGSQVALSMIRGENKRKIVISLMENGRPYKIADGCKAVFTATKPDGKFICNDCEIDIKNNQIIYYVTSQTTAAMGEVKCQLKLIGVDGGLLFSPTFSLIVANTLYSEQPILASSEEFNALTKYLADMQQKFTSPPYAIICEGAGENITLDDSADAIFKGFKIYGKSTQNGTPTPEAPIDIVSVGDDGTILSEIYGRNLIPYPYRDASIKTINGMTFEVQNDGGIKVSGTPTANSPFDLYKGKLLYNGNITVSLSGTATNVQIELILFDSSNTNIAYFSTEAKTTTINTLDYPKAKAMQISIKRSLDNVAASGIAYVQCEIGKQTSSWLPYLEKQSISLGILLKAIPVTDSSLATYTDSNGQMWCADEIDLERGVRVQRVSEYIAPGFFSTGTPNLYFASLDKTRNVINTKVISTHFEWAVSGALASTPIGKMIVRDRTDLSGPVVYCASNIATLDGFNAWIKENNVGFLSILATPIETPLSPEIISQYKELHTNLPNTTILNDENAFMEIEYIAEPKTYIKKNSGSIPKVATVKLEPSKWNGSKSPYSQVVNISGIPADYTGTVRLTPEQAENFRGKDVAFMVGNKNGIITVYCIGQKLTGYYDVEIKFEKEERI